MVVMSFIYLGFCVDTAIKEGSKVVLDKVWALVLLFSPAPKDKEEEKQVDDRSTDN
jgi:hypothetical protein